jgi:uncharacterized protein YegP (UPF0339 family)
MKIEVSEGSSGVWSWRFKADNGTTTIAEGSRTFDSRASAEKAVTEFASSLGVKAKDVSYVPLNPEPKEEQQ